MFTLFRRHKNCLVKWVLATWLLVSLASIHTHLCFDGQELPVTFHFSALDMDSHHTIDHGEDMDISLVKPLISKFFKIDLNLLLLTFLCLYLPLMRQAFRPVLALEVPLALRVHLKPPLRAPPVFSTR